MILPPSQQSAVSMVSVKLTKVDKPKKTVIIELATYTSRLTVKCTKFSKNTTQSKLHYNDCDYNTDIRTYVQSIM